jgi:hypothetical protein
MKYTIVYTKTGKTVQGLSSEEVVKTLTDVSHIVSGIEESSETQEFLLKTFDETILMQLERMHFSPIIFGDFEVSEEY